MTTPSTPAAPPELLRVEDLKQHFKQRGGLLRSAPPVRAVDGVSFTIRAGETLGLVGESGCGKSTTGRSIIRLLEPTAGKIIFQGQDITHLPKRPLRRVRRQMQLVFQDPYSSLDPRMSVHDIVAEPLQIQGRYDAEGGRRRVNELLELVGLSPQLGARKPKAFSGGQRQRIGIARALALRPKLLILDEPVSALDVSIQAQVVNLLQELQEELGLGYLFISHDLAVVQHISHAVAVMYLGTIVEQGPRDDIYGRPTHPYTQALLSAVPDPEPDVDATTRIVLRGDVPSPANPPSGCRFRTRCWKATERCADEVPELVVRPGSDHPSACHYADPSFPTADELALSDRD